MRRKIIVSIALLLIVPLLVAGASGGFPGWIVGPLRWTTGLGAITHLQGPTDQTFKVSATAPAAADASQAGVGTTVAASDAVAGTLTEGAAAGGSLTLQAGGAARLTSGNANGGAVHILPGAGIGSGSLGVIQLWGSTANDVRLTRLANSTLGVQYGDGSNYGVIYSSSLFVRQSTGSVLIPNNGQFKISSTTDGGGSVDTGIARSAAGVARISDGSTGMGKAMAEEFQVSSDSTSRAKLKVTKVTRAHDSALFNAAGLTDSEAIYTQPANSILIAAYMVLDTQFAAVGMTDLDVTLGDAGNNGGILNATMNLTSDAATTRYATKGAYFEATAGLLLREAATAWTAYATAVGANLDTTSAGSVSFYFVTLEW